MIGCQRVHHIYPRAFFFKILRFHLFIYLFFFSNLPPQKKYLHNIKLRVHLCSHGYFEPSSKRQRITRMKALIATLRKEVVVGVTCWELKPHLFNALVLPTILIFMSFLFLFITYVHPSRLIFFSIGQRSWTWSACLIQSLIMSSFYKIRWQRTPLYK